jgi:Fe-S-cluster containining protein
MNTESGNENLINIAQEEIPQLNNLVNSSSRVEQVYLVIDRTVELTKKVYPKSYCVSCPLTCCINDLFLPVTFIEWKSIESYLNNKVSVDTKDKIKSRLNALPANLFKEISSAKNNLHRYQMSQACPLLIDKKCSIFPFRPVSCRTYGFYLDGPKRYKNMSQHKNKNSLDACLPELNRWVDVARNSDEKILLSSFEKIEEALITLNRNKPIKLLIVWLKEYFEQQ